MNVGYCTLLSFIIVNASNVWLGSPAANRGKTKGNRNGNGFHLNISSFLCWTIHDQKNGFFSYKKFCVAIICIPFLVNGAIHAVGHGGRRKSQLVREIKLRFCDFSSSLCADICNLTERVRELMR